LGNNKLAKIAVYKGTTKAFAKQGNKKASSLLILEKTAEGAKNLGHDAVSVGKDFKMEPCDLAVIFGYGRFRADGSLPMTGKQSWRRKIIEWNDQQGIPTLCLDSGLFISRNRKMYFRAGLGSPLNNGDFFDSDYDDKRAPQVKADTDIRMLPYREKGDHIVLCLQPHMNWSMAGIQTTDWANEIIPELRKYTDRRIEVRNHPGDPGALERIEKFDNVVLTSANQMPIWKQCEGAHAGITYNSTVATDILEAGVPVFVKSSESHAWPVANTDLSKIEEPVLHDRTEWFNRMCYRMWTMQEMEDGTLVSRVLKYLGKDK
jgi:hypothetical protein